MVLNERRHASALPAPFASSDGVPAVSSAPATAAAAAAGGGRPALADLQTWHTLALPPSLGRGVPQASCEEVEEAVRRLGEAVEAWAAQDPVHRVFVAGDGLHLWFNLVRAPGLAPWTRARAAARRRRSGRPPPTAARSP